MDDFDFKPARDIGLDMTFDGVIKPSLPAALNAISSPETVTANITQSVANAQWARRTEYVRLVLKPQAPYPTLQRLMLFGNGSSHERREWVDEPLIHVDVNGHPIPGQNIPSDLL